MSSTPVRSVPVPAKIAAARAPQRVRKALLKAPAGSPATVPSTPNPNPTDPNPNPTNPNPPSVVHFSASSVPPPPPHPLKRTFAFVAEDNDGEESATDDDEVDYVPTTPYQSPADAVTTTNPPPAVNPHSPIRKLDARTEIADLKKRLSDTTLRMARMEAYLEGRLDVVQKELEARIVALEGAMKRNTEHIACATGAAGTAKDIAQQLSSKAIAESGRVNSRVDDVRRELDAKAVDLRRTIDEATAEVTHDTNRLTGRMDRLSERFETLQAVFAEEISELNRLIDRQSRDNIDTYVRLVERNDRCQSDVSAAICLVEDTKDQLRECVQRLSGRICVLEAKKP